MSTQVSPSDAGRESGSRTKRFFRALRRRLLTEKPRALLPLLAPTALAVALDLVLRARTLFGYAPQGKAIYGSSLLISAAVWTLPLWTAAWLFARVRDAATVRRRIVAQGMLGALFATWIGPLCVFGYGGQVLYFFVMHAYMGRDTVRLGFALRGTVTDWFRAWGSSLVLAGMLFAGLLVTWGLAWIARHASRRISPALPWLPAVTFFAALGCMSADLVDSRFLQAATPDDCFLHGVVHAVVTATTGYGAEKRGFTLRDPTPLPPLTAEHPRRNVIVVLTESVRADALCSAPASECPSRFFDQVIPDRIPLGKLTTVSSGTFTACMVLWTGLPVNADAKTVHRAPIVWEVAHALGYRTAYVTSQNFLFENFGAFVKRAGIDHVRSATDLGGLGQEQLGAPDERATADALEFLRGATADERSFVIVHLSNTHAPYRVDPELEPYTPHASDPLGDTTALRNHYQNSVLLQERTVAAFLGEVKKLPAWDDTVVVFLSDHGEEFRERGGLYHLHSLFDEEVRIPGFVAGGARALRDDERRALATFAGHRTYTHDVHATILDLLGVGAARAKLPFANPIARSLVALPGWTQDPFVPMSTTSAVWEPDDVRFGAMRGEHLLVSAPGQSWACYDIAADPHEDNALPPVRCGQLAFADARALKF